VQSKANLNFKTVNPYIDLLLKNNLLEVKQGRNVLYETTDRGLSLLDALRHINSQLSEFEEVIEGCDRYTG
jgi:predicted transcriptional regulator